MQIETLSDEQIKEFVEFRTNVFAMKIWNAAIEMAAKVALENGEGCRWPIAEEIRKLKK